MSLSMKLKNAQDRFRPFAFGCMVVYFLIVTAHLFFVPKFQGNINNSYHSIVKKNIEFFYYLVRNDRSVFNENKQVKIFQKTLISPLVFQVAGREPFSAKVNNNAGRFKFIYDRHYSYLLNRAIRI